jgi:hypothetical protein
MGELLMRAIHPSGLLAKNHGDLYMNLEDVMQQLQSVALHLR